MYKILMQQRKLEGMGLRISVDHSYFGESGDSDGLEAAPDRFLGTVIDWLQKRSKDPKLKVKFDGETYAITCPLATLLADQYMVQFERGADGGEPPALLDEAPPRERIEVQS